MNGPLPTPDDSERHITAVLTVASVLASCLVHKLRGLLLLTDSPELNTI